MGVATALAERRLVFAVAQRLHKEFPVFIAYLLAQIAIVVVLLPFFNFASDQIFYR